MHEENIKEAYLSQYSKTSESRWIDMKVPFDMHSIMIYDGYSFSKENKVLPSMTYIVGPRKGEVVIGKGGKGRGIKFTRK